MLKDIGESKRINANILEQFKQKEITQIESLETISSNNLKCLILSEQFWPKLKEEKVENMDEIDLSRISFSNEQQKRQAPTWQSDSFKELLQQQIKEVLNLYFSNTKVSSGGDIKSIKIFAAMSKALVRFQDYRIIKDVLSQTHIICEKKVKLEKYWKSILV